MRLGYPCQNLSLPSKLRTCRLQTMRQEGMEKIKELTLHNLEQLSAMLDWNIAHDITFFRVSSDIIPFATHPEMTWHWQKDDDVKNLTALIREKGEENQMRLSAHPGQYSVLNSPKSQVVNNAILDLSYHSDLLEMVGGKDIIVHTGGMYGDKEKAKKQFASAFAELPKQVRQRLRLENDDKVFQTKDVLDIHDACGVVLCFDIHHERCFQTGEGELSSLFQDVYRTWPKSEIPKVHISSGKASEKDRSHADYIRMEDFELLLRVLDGRGVDVMLEAKAKEKALLELRAQLKKESGENAD
ncbi:UV DNA damage repair endonuclease UvsE [Shouchella shacheensis]|uniref:UV DNA damage repair endonuclease UvsE n=1 Tax=Shouchella shacheensis TaxID=1649580 RepID=UPI0007404A0A|nr:UV DNA damage repair endonuclease UvsE [Shouchella shacheensis]